MVFVLFIVSRLLIFFGAFAAQKVVPYLGFFPYREVLTDYNLPSWILSFANFDGIHYLLIARRNYSQWEQAFFPLFPILIRALSYIIHNYLIAALFISNISFLIGLIIFNKLLKIWNIKTTFPLLLLLSFPTAFFFGVVYTEGLFFMVFILSLYFLNKKQYWLAGICAILSSATRLIGIFLIIPFFFHFLSEKKGALNLKSLITNLKLVIFSPFLGLFSYMAYLWKTTGDPLFFFHSQPIFGAHRSTHLILLPQVYYRYIRILLTARHDFQWYLSLLEMCVFSVVFLVLLLDLVDIIKKCKKPNSKVYFLLGINILSFFNLVLPTLTGTFSSIPRYALFSLSFFLYLGQLKSMKLKIGIIIVSITLQIILLSLFIQGYFVG